MKNKRTLLLVLLIGFLFNVFHDFVFYKIDPCMKTVDSLSIYEPKNQPSDPLCDIHENFHTYFALSQKFDFIENLNFFVDFKNITHILLKQFIVEIFKPPT
jgi:hypothetical protein